MYGTEIRTLAAANGEFRVDEWLKYLILAAIGVVAGTLNVLAGGGSFLTMPALMFAGVPPVAANATNRVAIFLQSIVAVWGFHRHGIVDWRYVPWAAIPATCGAALGAWAAVAIDPNVFRHVLAYLMIGVTLWTLWDPLKKRKPTEGEERPDPRTLPLAAGFFVVGIYGGLLLDAVYPLPWQGWEHAPNDSVICHSQSSSVLLGVVCVQLMTPVQGAAASPTR